jgi:predicted restriction endonuclease
MYCKYLSKCLNGKLRCKIKKTSIYITECQKCLKKEFQKRQSTKKVSSKRIIVTEETYNKVMQRDNYKCRLCGTPFNLNEHHIVYKSEDRKLINEPTNLIVLCTKCHALVHSNKHYWQPILKEMINK